MNLPAQLDGQLIAAVACVSLAAGYLLWRAVKLSRGSSSCGSCRGCSSSETGRNDGSQLFSIRPPASRRSEPVDD